MLGWWLLSRIVTLLAFLTSYELGPQGRLGASFFRSPLALIGAWDGIWYRRVAAHGYVLVPGLAERPRLLPRLSDPRLGAARARPLLHRRRHRHLERGAPRRRGCLLRARHPRRRAGPRPSSRLLPRDRPDVLRLLDGLSREPRARADRARSARSSRRSLARGGGVDRGRSARPAGGGRASRCRSPRSPGRTAAGSDRPAAVTRSRRAWPGPSGSPPTRSTSAGRSATRVPGAMRRSAGAAPSGSRARCDAFGHLPRALDHTPWLARDLVLLCLYALLLFAAARAGVGLAWIAAGALVLVLPLFSGSVMSEGRFGLLALPAYWGLAWLWRAAGASSSRSRRPVWRCSSRACSCCRTSGRDNRCGTAGAMRPGRPVVQPPRYAVTVRMPFMPPAA